MPRDKRTETKHYDIDAIAGKFYKSFIFFISISSFSYDILGITVKYSMYTVFYPVLTCLQFYVCKKY